MERATTGKDDISDFIFCIVTVALRVVLRSVPSTLTLKAHYLVARAVPLLTGLFLCLLKLKA